MHQPNIKMLIQAYKSVEVCIFGYCDNKIHVRKLHWAFDHSDKKKPLEPILI